MKKEIKFQLAMLALAVIGLFCAGCGIIGHSQDNFITVKNDAGTTGANVDTQSQPFTNSDTK